jgi:hypothetical protein
MEKLETHRRGGEEENGTRRAEGERKQKPNNEDKEQRRG